jgi:uncharacterized protein (TIGR02444 family)
MARILADLEQDPASGICMSSPLSPACDLWAFSLYHYARPGVSDLCLRLQDEQGANVNIVLWALWLGFRGQRLDSVLLAQAQRKVHSWDQHYILPLRQLRRRLKVEFGTSDDSIEAVRTQIKHAELLAEKHLQYLLETLPDSSEQNTVSHTQMMANNLRLYLHSLAVSENFADSLLELIIN